MIAIFISCVQCHWPGPSAPTDRGQMICDDRHIATGGRGGCRALIGCQLWILGSDWSIPGHVTVPGGRAVARGWGPLAALTALWPSVGGGSHGRAEKMIATFTTKKFNMLFSSSYKNKKFDNCQAWVQKL